MTGILKTFNMLLVKKMVNKCPDLPRQPSSTTPLPAGISGAGVSQSAAWGTPACGTAVEMSQTSRVDLWTLAGFQEVSGFAEDPGRCAALAHPVPSQTECAWALSSKSTRKEACRITTSQLPWTLLLSDS